MLTWFCFDARLHVEEIRLCSKLSLKNLQPIFVNGFNKHYTVDRFFLHSHGLFLFFFSFWCGLVCFFVLLGVFYFFPFSFDGG